MVEWTRYKGDPLEELVAVLVCRKFPQATRIRPSSGDGGIDLLLRLPDGSVEVFQVKGFHSNLSASQKQQIRGSVDRLEQYRADNELNVSAWHLALPLDPTKENLTWLAEVTADLPYACDWRGLSYLDGLAAEFPDVVDYYVGNGRERLEAVVGQLTRAMGMQPNEGDGLLSPAQLRDYLGTLAPLLDTDPHFRYEVSVGPLKPYFTFEPGLIFEMTESAGTQQDSAVTVKIFARFEAALDFRPIPGTLVIRAEVGSDLQRQLVDFEKYGTEICAPHGTADLQIDLPGGLGGAVSGAALRIIPTQSEGAEDRLLRLATIDPGDATVASVLVKMMPPTFGFSGTGARATGVEQGGSFEIEFRTDETTQNTTLQVSPLDVTGRPPHEVIEGLRFLSSLYPPNQLAIAAARGPLGSTLDLSSIEASLDTSSLTALLNVAASLSVIQDHTTTQITLPEPSFIKAKEVEEWTSARRLLEGEQLRRKPRDVRVCLLAGVSPPRGSNAIMFYSNLTVTVGSAKIQLGTLLTSCPSAEVDADSVTPHEDHIDCSFRPTNGSLLTTRLISTS